MNRVLLSSCIFLVLTCLFSFPAATAMAMAASYNLTNGESISLGGRSNTLVSANERFELGFFNPDGKRNCWFLCICYFKLRPLTFVWVANPEDPVRTRSGGQFKFLPNGSIALLDGGGKKTFFMAGNSSFPDSQTTLTLTDSGNLVLTSNVSETPLWQSFENPSDTFLPGMKMNGKLRLTSWEPKCEDNTNGDESSTFRLEMNDDENYNSLVIKNESSTIWKNPESFYGSDKLFDQVSKLLFKYGDGGDYNSTHIVMNSTGQIQFWNMSTNPITLVWSAPENNCSKYGFCGKYASCNNENTQFPCRCLPGYKRGESASSKDCSQQLCIDEGKNDRFAKLKVKKVISPDTPYDLAKDEAACEKECLSKCSCKAYAYEPPPRSLPDDANGIACRIWYIDITDMEESSSSGKIIHIRFRPHNYRQCDNGTCGYNLIPYPLSTGANCGDPNYSDFSCNSSTDELKFTIGNLSLPVTRIDGEDRSFHLQIPNNATCINMMDNLQLPNGKKYHVLPDSCDSSSSHDNLQIIWDPPPEPICNSGDEDCEDWPNSTCKNRTNPGEKRCICNPNYQWNGTSLICTPDAGDPTSSQPRNLKMIVVITVVTAGSGFLLLGLVAFLGYRRTLDRRRRRRESEDRIARLYDTEKRVKNLMDTSEFNEEDKKGIDVPFFDLKTILEATNYFSDENKLGEGGFGPVYKGIFPGGQEIAVKRLSSKSVQGLEEFKNEVVLIAKLQHRNLVRLLGYCVKGDEKILLYEYMKNRSLDAFIFDRTLCLIMDWKKRFEIIMGIARGLLYLHQDSRLRIIHRDLKTSNILLDEEMNPKISDFGLARIVGGSETEANTMRIIGTYGYMSPEYALDGLFSIKSDVFSFGVIVLEIISGRRNTGFYESRQALNLLGYAWNLWLEENIDGLMDQAMPVESCNRGEVLRCVNVGLLCVQEDPGDRPTMSNVVFTLGNETATLPIPKQPAFVVKKWLRNDESSSSSRPEINSTNTITCTMEEGR